MTTELIGYGGTWKYLLIGVGAGAPSGWNQPGYDDSAWSTGTAPFGVSNGQCPIYGVHPPVTNWPRSNDLLIRGTRTLAGRVDLVGPVDDDIDVYVDGTEVPVFRSGIDPCAERDDWAATGVQLAGPTHLLAFRCWNLGSQGPGDATYFDMRVLDARRGFVIGHVPIGAGVGVA